MGPEVIDKLKKYAKSKAGLPLRKMSLLRNFYTRHRTHSSLVHYSIALFPFALLAQLMGEYLDGERLRFAGVFMTVCGSIMLLPAFISGFITFGLNRGFKTRGNYSLRVKIFLTPFIALSAATASYMGIASGCSPGPEYSALLMAICFFMIIMEFNGKKLTFKDID